MGRLFWKFFLAFWVALLVAGIGVGTAVWLHNHAKEGDAPLATGRRTTYLINSASATLKYGGVNALKEVMTEWDRHGDAHLFVVDAQGRELLGRPVPPESLARARSLAQTEGDPPVARQVSITNDARYLLFIPAAAAPLSSREPPSPLAPILNGIFASLGFSALLAWYLAKPIRYLRGAFDAVAAGKLDTRVGPLIGKRRDEVADLVHYFDRMAQQLQILIGSQQRLLHDVSHELRSPLARLQVAVGLARQQPEQWDRSLDRIEREAGRLDELVGELLTLSRLEAGVNSAPDEEINLVDLVADIADDARFEAAASGRQLHFIGEGDVIITACVELLHRAFENVIRNAVKYTQEGTTVEVQVDQLSAPHRLIVTVADRGPGIPENELEAIFEPFFQSQVYAKATGFGLGLAIARRAIAAHGGSIQALNRPGGGLTITIMIPVKRHLR